MSILVAAILISDVAIPSFRSSLYYEPARALRMLENKRSGEGFNEAMCRLLNDARQQVRSIRVAMEDSDKIRYADRIKEYIILEDEFERLIRQLEKGVIRP